MAAKLRVGILGAGEAGTGQAQAFAHLPDVEVAALWSHTPQRAKQLAAKLHLSDVQVYEDWQTLVEDADLDIISVATPTMLHLEPFLMALDRGRHVLVEYPLSENLQDAMAMAQAAQRAKTVTAVCLNWRYVPAIQTIWHEIQKGRIGQIRDVRTEYRYRRLTNRYYTERGAINDVSGEIYVACLEFDKVRLFTGSEIKRIASSIAPYFPPKNKDFTVWEGSSFHLAELMNGTLAGVRVTATAG
ncbi:MAG: Gfo/Idh/MocA family oxidoreductase, partial [Anaerolineae bacterium]|nr:Gfo/Idh/MocA family oxidoreductase [Anaerolineae bacterium]